MSRAAKLAAAERKARAAAAVAGINGDRAVAAMHDSLAISRLCVERALDLAEGHNLGAQTILNAIMQQCMNALFRIDPHAATDVFACVVDVYRARANGNLEESGPELAAFYAAGARLVAIEQAQHLAGGKH